MVKEMFQSILTFFSHNFHNIPIQYDTEKRLKRRIVQHLQWSLVFSLTFKLFHQRMIKQTKVKNMLKTISRRLKFTNLIKLGAFQHFYVKYLAQWRRGIQIFRFFLIFCYFNFLAFMLSKDCVDNIYNENFPEILYLKESASAKESCNY